MVSLWCGPHIAENPIVMLHIVTLGFHRTIRGGVGHNLPQEAPQAFAQVVLDVKKT